MAHKLTRMRVEIKAMDSHKEISYVCRARNIAHAIYLADKFATKQFPGEAVSFSSWRNPMPKGGYDI